MADLRQQTRMKLLDAAQASIRAKGYAATSVDDICAGAGVTKGGFFHYFKSKQDAVLAAVDHWNEFTGEIFATAPYAHLADPRDRVLGYVDFRMEILDRPVPEFTCLLGALVQELYQTHEDIRAACDAGMSAHIATIEADIAEARSTYAPDADWSAESLGYFIQSVLQGSFIYSKAKHEAETARANLRHLRRYIESLLPISL
ncbi:TetR/AcrR family transcriptional regulator [Rhizobium sp. TRM95796]|uniref:TetR/AcrR family transcriptional regulator n=1 Tax=Rhizobium sp. TRM95796 TaxID=2979862 RepID=UPI0021E7F824|nr:TetR/AcrR family transcriptional regulator [Rhizobium sp. TRM95796]MCV3765033.1 TetR/AcrR family transcriptional regulator [Rhizobium sp. TRM95796]